MQLPLAGKSMREKTNKLIGWRMIKRKAAKLHSLRVRKSKKTYTPECEERKQKVSRVDEANRV
jgi:hypothetical protein